MELRIKGELEQIRKMIPIIDKMLEAGFISEYPFIAPFQYGEDQKETAIIKGTKSGNLIIEHMTSKDEPRKGDEPDGN